MVALPDRSAANGPHDSGDDQISRITESNVPRDASSRSRPSVALMAGAMAVSWLSMLGHNLAELPLRAIDVENTGPLVVDLVLLLAYWRRPASRAVPGAILAWASLNLVVGGVVTVLPLPFLPFEPEQALGHYLTHVGYAVGQLPLVLCAWKAVRAAARAPSS